ncbi:helix-turn-helix domain-containing protein [Thermus thermophilus]|uniref:helix-turn-helix domain-containing protein n=1 Tax=Thermus thermophilus TaxID=274 RepID=UPI001FCDF75D|nr:helix-turn-helix transcriptional regulator [Thermus thermophilus]
MTTLDRAEVGEALRRRRKELGLTLGDVARSMGTSDGYVWKLEQGLINLQNVPLPQNLHLFAAGISMLGDPLKRAAGFPSHEGCHETSSPILKTCTSRIPRINFHPLPPAAPDPGRGAPAG